MRHLRSLVAVVMTLLLIGCADAREERRFDEYIPADLEDCFSTLNELLYEDEIEKIRLGSEEDMAIYHFSLGLTLRNNWGLWSGSRLASWFNERGITHPDDMSGIILDSYWRFLNDKPIELEKQIRFYQEYWEEIEKPEGDA